MNVLTQEQTQVHVRTLEHRTGTDTCKNIGTGTGTCMNTGTGTDTCKNIGTGTGTCTNTGTVTQEQTQVHGTTQEQALTQVAECKNNRMNFVFLCCRWLRKLELVRTKPTRPFPSSFEFSQKALCKKFQIGRSV